MNLKKNKSKYLAIVLIIFVVAAITYQLNSNEESTGKVKINFNFLLRPYFQAEPRVFIKGEWKSLLTSQSNMLSEDGKNLVVCGTGGLYIYNMSSDSTDYIYNQSWYPCYNIFYLNESVIAVESLVDRYNGERALFNVIERKMVGEENVSAENVLNRYNSYFETKEINTSEMCNEDNSTCAKLNNNGTVNIIYKNGSAQNTNINKAIALVGFKNNILFFATDGSYGSVLNHHLYAYNIDEKISEMLLDNFRYDYEIIVFF